MNSIGNIPYVCVQEDSPGGSVVKNLIAGLILGLERSPGGGNVNLFHCSCLGNPMVREEPGKPHSMWSQRVRHDLVAKQQTTKLVSVKYMC